MFDANIKIISELKKIVSLVTDNREILDKFCRSEKDFTKERKLSFDKLTLLIARLCKKTLSVEIENFFDELNVPMPCSVSAFTQQRIKLEPLFFYYWNMVLCRSYYIYSTDIKRWKGYRLVAGDGSSVSLVNTPALSDYFGGQSNQEKSFVLAKTFYCYDVLNKIILSSQIKPYRYGEMKMAHNITNIIEEDMVMIYDRNFSNYKMAALHQWQEIERKYIIRAKESTNIIKSFIESEQTSAIIYMKPTA